MTVNEKLSMLRNLMNVKGIDAYIVPSEDAHQSEYVCDYWKSREWISGFDGSAGTVVVTRDKACLWADGRYHIQAEEQIKDSEFELHKSGLDGVLTYREWIRENLPKKSTVGLDGRTFSVESYKKLADELDKKDMKIVSEIDLISEIWNDRPVFPVAGAFAHDVKFAGKSVSEKLESVREKMKRDGISSYLISSLDDIAWLLNMRGGDMAYLPVVYSYTLVEADSCYLFTDKNKINKELEESFTGQVIIKEYSEIIDFLKAYKPAGKVFINPSSVSIILKNSFPSGTEFREGNDYTSELKSVKNEIEIRNMENSQVKDGVAMVKFHYWLQERLKTGKVTEVEVSDKLLEFRKSGEHCIGASFSTIAAYMGNAAMMHYSPTAEKCAEMDAEGFLLVDSGGQYLDGTTDITRTLVLGDITDEMKKDFTFVLKSHIGLARVKFLYGASGANLDYAARKAMWDNGLDYKSGTGHGVGYFLSVHEGPQRIGMSAPHVKLETGMVVTNEPGIYKEGKWGIRTENTLIVEDDYKNENGRFMKFRTISYCPIDLKGIDTEMLTTEERAWLNDYHALVREKLSERLDENHKKWLDNATKAV